MNTYMSIAEEIEARIVHLSSPGVTWVQGTPLHPRESCLLRDGGGLPQSSCGAFSQPASDWLDEWWLFATAADSEVARGVWPDVWNDFQAKDLEQVIDMLADAWEDAIEAGI